MVVDDDNDLRFVVRLILEQGGYVVDDAPDGSAALAMLEQPGSPRPDVIVADARMPGLGGNVLAIELRARPSLESIPVILLTGDRDLRGQGSFAGLVLLKPFEPDELLRAIDTVAANQK